MDQDKEVIGAISPVSFHHGPLLNGSFTLLLRTVFCPRDDPMFGGPFLAVEILGIGYYAGWFNNNLWEEMRKKNIVKKEERS